MSNENGGFFGNGDGAWFLIILFLFAFCGWGGGWNGNGGNQGAADNYVLASDFAQVERKIDDVNNGLCNGFYTTAQQINGVQMGLSTQGYETRNAITQAQIAQMQSANALTAQLAQCCCDTRSAIADVNYNIATQANGIGRQIERGFADTGYAMATNTCSTLQAIDKVGDRIIDYMSNKENQNLRDELQAMRLAASQQAQNAYLIDQLGTKCPIPAYLTCNPNAPLNYNVTYGNGCGCA